MVHAQPSRHTRDDRHSGHRVSYTETQNAGQEAPQAPQTIWYWVGVLVLVLILYALTR
jgi:hypothetical protein